MVTTALANSPSAWTERATAATSWDAAMWSERGQQARFDAVLQHLELADGDTLLDYGCGTGALNDRLPDGVRYYAHDWSDAMLARTKKEHPGATVLDERDLDGMRFDHVVAVGPFNLKDGWWKQRTWDTLAGLWRAANKSLVVSLYRGDDTACLRYSPIDVAVLVGTLGARRFTIDGSYLDNDLLVAVYR